MSTIRTVHYTFQRGETIEIPVTDDGAVEGEESLIRGALKPFPSGKWEIPAGLTATALTTEFRAADESFAKGWTFTLAADASADLTTGFYQFDYTLTFDGSEDVVKGPPAIV